MLTKSLNILSLSGVIVATGANNAQAQDMAFSYSAFQWAILLHDMKTLSPTGVVLWIVVISIACQLFGAIGKLDEAKPSDNSETPADLEHARTTQLADVVTNKPSAASITRAYGSRHR